MRVCLLIFIISDTLLATAASIEAPPDGTYGGFAFACFWPGNVLTGDKYGIYTAGCPPSKGLTWRLTELNLSHCLHNDHGRLVWKKEGNAMGSCRNCARLDVHSTNLTCDCMADGGQYQLATIDINDGINLSPNNSLACFGIEDDVIHNVDPDVDPDGPSN
ncbi:hypothetical protein V8F20_012363 [Naviculisporaceae sp. PSN 640]